MPSSPIHLLNRDDLRKPPQYVAEGTTPATYGVVPGDPRFIAALQQAVLEKANEPEFIDNEYGGYHDRQGVRKVRERNRVTLRGRLRPNDFPIVTWGTYIPGAANTPAESRTFVDSYLDSDGTEIYRVWRGCRPMTTTITITPTEPVMLEMEIYAQRYFETETLADAFAIGNGAFAVGDPVGTPLPVRRHRGSSFTITRTFRFGARP